MRYAVSNYCDCNRIYARNIILAHFEGEQIFIRLCSCPITLITKTPRACIHWRKFDLNASIGAMWPRVTWNFERTREFERKRETKVREEGRKGVVSLQLKFPNGLERNAARARILQFFLSLLANLFSTHDRPHRDMVSMYHIYKCTGSVISLHANVGDKNDAENREHFFFFKLQIYQNILLIDNSRCVFRDNRT